MNRSGQTHALALGDLFFQSDLDGDMRSLAIAFFCALLTVRRQLLTSNGQAPLEVVSNLVLQVLDHPWTSSSLPTLTRKERRNARAAPPPLLPGYTVYRCDGVLLDSHDPFHSAVGWGTARWSVEGRVAESARGRLVTGSSRNVAQYHALWTALQRAHERRGEDTKVLFEVSSMVVARQVQPYGSSKYACRSEALLPLYLRCVDAGRRLEEAGVQWAIRHVYAEFNKVSSTLAREAVALGSRDWTCP